MEELKPLNGRCDTFSTSPSFRALNLEAYDSIVLGHIIQWLVIGLGVWIIQTGGMCLLEAYRIQSEKRTVRDFTQAALERMREGGPGQRRWFEETSRDVTRLLECSRAFPRPTS